MSVLATLEITSIAAGGDGVARHDGLAVFVPRSAPGDRLRALLQSKGRFARGAIVEIEQPGPGRVAPACAHYAEGCGGCQLQHLSLDAQRAAKAQVVRDAFQRIGGSVVPLPEVRAIGGGFRYRRKLTVALHWTGTAWRAGLHRAGAPQALLPLNDCLITDERVVAGTLAVLAQGAQCWPRAPKLRVSLRLAGDDLLLVVEGGTRWPAASALADALSFVSAAWWVAERGERRLLFDRRPVPAPGASFAQVNEAVSDALGAHVTARVTAYAPSTVVDGYAGAGDLAVVLSAKGIVVTAIELDAESSAWCAARLPSPSRAITARVEDVLAGALPADVVVLNPPRAGVDGAVMEALAACEPRPRAIVYVSCDPATLARDVARLPGWRVASLVCFDMFPQTAHVETVCELVPEAA